jgi:hypothetical protein
MSALYLLASSYLIDTMTTAVQPNATATFQTLFVSDIPSL